jgi:glycine/D-amino acid oxidase-like deaminating enzyme
VALTDEDMDYLPGFLAACAACGIPTRELTAAEALALEPGLNPALKAAVLVPDATMDAMRLPLRFFATALGNGARLRPFTEVTAVERAGPRVTGVVARDHLTGRDLRLEADLVVNAAGPWCGRVAAMAGAAVPVRPSPGVLLAVAGRLCDLVVNRLHPAADGDIVVPQRSLTIVGTSGTWAFVINRLTALGLVGYLYLHLVILAGLLRGPEAWDGLVALFRQPLFLALDVVLVLGLAVHGLNGLRVALVGSGLLVDRQRALLAAAGILAGLVVLVAAVRIFA